MALGIGQAPYKDGEHNVEKFRMAYYALLEDNLVEAEQILNEIAEQLEKEGDTQTLERVRWAVSCIGEFNSAVLASAALNLSR